MKPNFTSRCIISAQTANARGQFDSAVGWCQQALNRTPNMPAALYNLSIAYRGQGLIDQAINSLIKTALLTIGDHDAQNTVGLELIELGALNEAEQCLQRAISMAPEFAFAYSNLGMLYEKQKLFEKAEACFRIAIKLQPSLAPVYANLCGILNMQKKYDAAKIIAQKAIELDPLYPGAWINFGSTLCGLKQYGASEAAARKAIELAPRSSEAWSNLGTALYEMNKYGASEAAARKAIELDPQSSEAWSNLGSTLCGLKQYGASVAAARKAIELDPLSSEAWSNLGFALLGMKRHKDAADCLNKALEIDPDAEFCLGHALHAKISICDWGSLTKDLPLLIQQISQNKNVAVPFNVLALTTDLAIQHRAAEIYAKEKYPEQNELGIIKKRPRRDKIRIGYFSADFRNHPVSYQMAELFELHDKDRFELIGFSFGPDSQDEMRQRVSAAFDRFIDARNISDKEVAELSREMGIDIAVDLMGYTKDCRTAIFSYQAAPIQVNYLGYPGTMGASYIDYVIVDKALVPINGQPHYSEKAVYLPNSYMVNDAKRQISCKIFTRDELGLPSTGFVFCCFNNSFKITPATFDGWMRILEKVEGSVLWLSEANPDAAANLRKEAELRDIDPARLIFARRLPMLSEHLARIRQADLFIDTLPYNAHATACDALWVGLPVLTCMGESFASRVAASLLHAIGLPELVTASQAEYEALAVELATSPERLVAIRQKLENNRLTMPLFDTSLFRKHIEAAYTTMYERYQADLPPDHIFVSN